MAVTSRNNGFLVTLDLLEGTPVKRTTVESKFFIEIKNDLKSNKARLGGVVIVLEDSAKARIEKEEFLRREEALLIEGL